MAGVVDLVKARRLISSLVVRDLKTKYRGTVGGQLWSLANPLTILAVYTVVFSFLMRVSPPPGDPSGLDTFALWLMCGLLPWLAFANNVQQGITAVIGNAPLIQKVAMPRAALVIASSLSALVTWAVEMAVLIVVLVFAGSDVLLFLPMVVLLMVLLWFLGTGAALIFSVLNVYFRDTQHFVAILIQIWFFVTPVLYPLVLVEERSAQTGPLWGPLTVFRLYMMNPLSEFIIAFRNVLYDNRLPDPEILAVCFGAAAVVFCAGIAVFNRFEKRLPEAL